MQFRFPTSVATLAVVALAAAALSACSTSHDADGVIHVPGEAATLADAEKLAQPGDMILIAPGIYEEQLEVTTPDITVRGESRNETVIDGGGVRPYGIVVTADGVRVENLTVTNATFYGLLFTGLHDETGPQAPTASNYEPWDPDRFPPLQRFLADHVTAVNNGLYGVYAFNAQHGAIVDSYASGSADSGFYVGQCNECDVLVSGNVAERNAVGFENSNANDSVVVAGNRFSGNRVGLTLLSNYQEAFVPQRGNAVIGNLIIDNVEPQSPAQADGGFGTGIGISGGVENLIARNVIAGHPRAGVMLANTEDLPARDNAFIDNLFERNEVDLANISADRSPATGNCAASEQIPTTLPETLAAQLAAGGCSTGSDEPPFAAPDAPAQAAAASAEGPEAPPGFSYRRVAHPLEQPELPQRAEYPKLPSSIEMPSLADFGVPSPQLLEERTGSR